MKIVAASELIGPALDWAVGAIDQPDWEPEDLMANLYLDDDGYHYSPSTNWTQGGPILEQEGIEITRCNDLYFPSGNEHGEHYEQYWKATIDLNEGDFMVQKEYGPTPLIAAMRCYVASKLGSEVEIPKELLAA